MRINCLLVALLVLLSSCADAVAQTAGIRITYDYLHPDRTSWVYVRPAGDTLRGTGRNIRVRQETPVSVSVVNCNVEVIQPEVSIRRGARADSVVATGISDFFSRISGVLVPGMGLDLRNLLTPKARGEKAGSSLIYAPMQIDLSTADLLASASLVDLESQLRDRLTEAERWRSIQTRLRGLRYNTTLPKTELTRQADELVRQLTPTALPLLTDGNTARQVFRQLALENAEYMKYVLTLFKRQATRQPVSRGDTDAPSFNSFAIAESARIYEKTITDELADQLTATLYEVVTHYSTLRQNTFTASCNATVNKGSEALLIQFYDTTVPDKRKLTRSEHFQIDAPGRVQLVTSFGLSFMGYSQPPQAYGLIDGKISATDLDRFSPAITGLFHVFKRSASTTRLGAHLGAAVPLSDAKAVGFLIGPSLALGGTNVICLNAGIFTGRTTRLSKGLAVGDKYSSTSLLTVNRYALGYQVGVSFVFGQRR